MGASPLKLLLILVLILGVSGCAHQKTNSGNSGAEQPVQNKQTALESLNRKTHAFNTFLDTWLLKPVATGYDYILPEPVESMVERFFDNLQLPVQMLNDLLQGKLNQFGEDTGRLLVNSTLGIGGLFDVASGMGIAENDSEDFGQTLATWGVGSGPYVVLPFLGPSTLRDAFTGVLDGYLGPLRYYDGVPARNSLYGLQVISLRNSLLGVEKLQFGDGYDFLKDVYLQRREYKIKDGNVESKEEEMDWLDDL